MDRYHDGMVNGVIERVYEDPSNHWIMVLLRDCVSCNAPHLFRVRELPIDEAWLERHKGQRVLIKTTVELRNQPSVKE